jgi:[CysO sulfur-carrier protein]-S-L-cysteine hydrolase
MRVPRTIRAELVAHAREEAPNECCGYAWGDDGALDGVERGVNDRKSPYGFQLDSKSMLGAWKRDEEEGRHVAIYHSHPRSPAEPSQQDINTATFPDWTYLIVSLAGEPDIRAWKIADGRVEEEPIVVD